MMTFKVMGCLVAATLSISISTCEGHEVLLPDVLGVKLDFFLMLSFGQILGHLLDIL